MVQTVLPEWVWAPDPMPFSDYGCCTWTLIVKIGELSIKRWPNESHGSHMNSSLLCSGFPIFGWLNYTCQRAISFFALDKRQPKKWATSSCNLEVKGALAINPIGTRVPFPSKPNAEMRTTNVGPCGLDPRPSSVSLAGSAYPSTSYVMVCP